MKKSMLFCVIVAFVFVQNTWSATTSLLGVDDQGRWDSQFLKADCWGNDSTNIGNTYKGYDIEAMDSTDIGGIIYAISGESKKGNYKIHTVTSDGILSDGIGLNLLNEAQGASFRTGTNHLWVSVENDGISYIDVSNSYAVTAVTADTGVGKDWKGVAWKDADTLYGINDDGILYEYHYSQEHGLTKVRAYNENNGGLASDGYEGMEFDPDGNLIVAKGSSLFQVDLSSDNFGELTDLAKYSYLKSNGRNQARDIESFTFIPEPTTIIFLSIGCAALFRKKRKK